MTKALGELFAPDNEITSVADDTFATNTHLGYIELNNNSLTAVPPLGGLTNLTMLSLTNNRYKCRHSVFLRAGSFFFPTRRHY